MILLNYTQAAQILGLAALSVFGFYALKLVASFRTGILAKSWRQITIGAIFLISAQLPLLIAAIGLFGADYSLLIELGTIMRFLGVIFLAIGLRTQCQLGQNEKQAPAIKIGSAQQKYES